MSTQHDPSGHSLAEEAYAAGAVERDAEQIPAHSVALRFTIHGDEGEARRLADALALELMARSDVTACDHTVTTDAEYSSPHHSPNIGTDGRLRDTGDWDG